MRRKIKTLINSYKTYNNLVWGSGGIYDSLAGEELNDMTDKEYKTIDECYSNIVSIMNYKNNGVPTKETLLKYMNKYDVDDLYKLVNNHYKNKNNKVFYKM